MSAQEGAEAGDVAREPKWVKISSVTTRLDGSKSGGHEPGSTERTPQAVEVGKAETSTRDAGQADGKEMEEVMETSQDAR
jgi:hypothetical protein